MRNSTKLKNILLKYSLALDMDDGELFRLTLVDKASNEMASFEGKSYGDVLKLAYSFMLKEIKVDLPKKKRKKSRKQK
jgi:hypothetical protein